MITSLASFAWSRPGSNTMTTGVCLHFTVTDLQSRGRSRNTLQCALQGIPMTVSTYTTFETVVSQIRGSAPTILAVIYQAPKYCNAFLNDFSLFLSSCPTIVLLGDFNIHVDNVNNALTRDFISCLDNFGLQQFTDLLSTDQGHTRVLHHCIVLHLSYLSLIIN